MPSTGRCSTILLRVSTRRAVRQDWHWSCANCGHLGLLERGQTVPEFEKALSRLPIGEIARHPLETRYGFHIVLLHHREPGQPLPFEALRSDIAAYLREHAQRRAISQYLRILAGEADIEGIDLDAATSALTPCTRG